MTLYSFGITNQENKPITRRWFLDLAVKETLEIEDYSIGSGLNFVKNDEALYAKLKQGFLDVDPDAPRQIDLSENDVQSLVTQG